MTRPHTGASALLALLTWLPASRAAGEDGYTLEPHVARSRKSLRNAIRYLLRAHDWKVDDAAAALRVSGNALCAAGAAVGLKIRGRVAKGRPRFAVGTYARSGPLGPGWTARIHGCDIQGKGRRPKAGEMVGCDADGFAVAVKSKETREIVAYIRRSCSFWAPETRIRKLYDIVSQYKTEAQDVIIEALRALPLPEQQACGVDLLVKNAAA